MKTNKKKWLLGYLKHSLKDDKPEPVYLRGFEWQCEWYWSGGYVGNKDFHCHFDGCFLDVPDIRGHFLGDFITPWQPKKENSVVLSNGCSVWEDLSTFLNQPQYTPDQWWRIKDLYKQFYSLRNAAEVFQYGGHCSSLNRSQAELNKALADQINKHIETVIIPEIEKALNKA